MFENFQKNTRPFDLIKNAFRPVPFFILAPFKFDKIVAVNSMKKYNVDIYIPGASLLCLFRCTLNYIPW